MRKTLINILKFLFFLGIGVSILYYLYNNYSAKYVEDCMAKGATLSDCNFMTKLINDFKSVNPFWIFMVFVTFSISNFSRAIRWQMLLKPLGRKPRLVNTFFCTMIGYFTNLFLPRAGEVIKAGTLSKYENIPVEKVMGTVVLDRLLDVISIFIVTGLALILEYDKLWGYFSGPIKKYIDGLSTSTFAILGGTFLLGIAAIIFFRKAFSETAFFKKLSQLLQGFKEGILSVKKLDQVWIFIFHSVMIWLMYFMMVYFCFFAFGPTENLKPIVALMAFVFGAWGIVVPSPGGMGSYHFLTVAVLGMYGISESDAFSFANISFCTIQIAINVSFGILGFLIISYLNKNYHPEKLTPNPDA